MNRRRYEGYLAARAAIDLETLDDSSVELLRDLAEGLMLARDAEEAAAARERVAEALERLVDRGRLSARTANRLWAHMRGCAPPLRWPRSWDRSRATARGEVASGH
jgi:hypothetical protein